MQRFSGLFLILMIVAQSVHADPLNVLFLGGGGGGPETGHNGKINHHKLIPEFLRSGIEMTYSDNLNDLSPQTLASYEVVILYIGTRNDKPERIQALISFVENGGGLVALHHTCGAFEGDKEFVSLIGGEFASHGSGWFSAKHIKGQSGHPALGGVPEFEVWDETYVHKNLNADRTDLQVRDEKGRPEPWTWVREQGRGRVFYTAHGHDGRAWENQDFQKMIAAATIWTANRTPEKPSDIPVFTYRDDVNKDLYNHENRRGTQKIQDQLTPEESARCMVLQKGFEAQLVVHEPDIVNPIDIVWDDRGRLYVVETVDYPFIKEEGSDRIILCEDTDNDGKADKFTVFAEGFSLLTGMCWVNGGIILAQAPDMYFLKDTDGDDRADIIKKINTGWGTGDLHGGPSNLKYGLDNKIYGCLGGGGHWSDRGRFSAGIWRMEVDGSNFTPISNLGDNSWALGITEDFELFASSANRGPAKHVHAPYPYFDAIGLKKVPALNIFDFHTYYPLTVTRQGDHFGSYTAGSGFDIYTARSFPENYWNRAAFIGGPTGKLLGQFFLSPDGEGSYKAKNGGSLMASFDEYTAPIRGKTGPDGHVYMLDWNNLIMLHGGEVHNPLRDKSHGRIYRIVYQEGEASPMLDLRNANTDELVAAFHNENMFWRVMAQQKIVQQKRMDAIPLLIQLAKDEGIDATDSNPAVIHALWTLHGLGQMDVSNAAALEVAHSALKHWSAAVRKNALRVLPVTEQSARLLTDMLSEKDANTLRNVFLALSTMPPSDLLGERLYAMRNNIQDKTSLTAPFHLALIRHGSGLVEPLIAESPERDRRQEATEKENVIELQNLLKNPSFEEVQEGLPVHWISKVNNGKANLSIDSTVARTGKNSGRIESSAGGGGEFLVIPRLKPGEYILTAWVKTKDVVGPHGILIRAAGHGLENTQTSGLKGTHDDWQQLQLNFRVKEEGGVLLFCLFGAWAATTGTAWFDDISLFQLSSEEIINAEIANVNTLLAKQAFAEGADAIIRITEQVATKSEQSTTEFMEGLTYLRNIPFTESQIEKLTALAADASPKNKEHLAIFAVNHGIDLGLSELANRIKGFEAKILEGNAERGKELARACIVCHGSDFSGIPAQRTPSLPQFSTWYLQTQLQKYRHNIRGYDVSDADGFLMKTLMSNYSHQQIADLAAFIKTFQVRPQTITLGGDPEKGKALYANCVTCHKENAQGNRTLQAPRLAGLSDVYIFTQLLKFRNGSRGSAKGDLSGRSMQIAMEPLKDEQAMKDVAAYLTSLELRVERSVNEAPHK